MRYLRFLALVLLLAPEMIWAATYRYQGGHFSDGQGDYALSMSVSGWFTTATPLAAGIAAADIGDQVLGYRFSDGLQTLTDANSRIGLFQLSTDAAGSISSWFIYVQTPPDEGGRVGAIYTLFQSDEYYFDRAFTDAMCDGMVFEGTCDPWLGSPNHLASLNQDSAPAGRWTLAPTEDAAPAAPIPVLGPVARWLLLMLIAAAGLAAMRRRMS